MNAKRFQDIWVEQCEAGRGVREKHGVVAALGYLIGEKLMNFAETAVTHPEFARELPRFVAEIRGIFCTDEIRVYLEHLERMDAQKETEQVEPDDDVVVFETPKEKAARRARFVRLKELLTAGVLGTS